MSRELVTVATFRFLPEAEAAKLCLEAEGLTTFLADVETVNMDWFLGNAIGNIKLQVPSPQAEAAAALLEQMRGDRKRRKELAGVGETNVCLACGAAPAAGRTAGMRKPNELCTLTSGHDGSADPPAARTPAAGGEVQRRR